MSYLLFLDDERNPPDAEAAMGLEVVVARSPREFVRAVTERGGPSVVCFDYQLGAGQVDGYEMARWLVSHDREHDVISQEFMCISQSLNKDAAKSIERLMRDHLVAKFPDVDPGERRRGQRAAERALRNACVS